MISNDSKHIKSPPKKFLICFPITPTFYLNSGMILSNKEKTGKLCNTKSGRHAHVEDMSRARRSRCAFLGGFGGMPPQEIFCFQHGFLDF